MIFDKKNIFILTKMVLFFLPLVLSAGNLKEIIEGIDKNLLVRSSQKKSRAYQELYAASKTKELPRIYFDFSAIRLRSTPKAIFKLEPLAPDIEVPVGTKSNIDIGVGFVYPLFTGYAISSAIKKSKLNLIKSKLQTKNLQRELYLKVIKLYSSYYTVSKAILAQKEAVKALEISLNKANEMYKNELLSQSALYNIKSKLYDMRAKEEMLVSQKESLKNLIKHFSGVDLKDNISIKKPELNYTPLQILKIALKNRSDIKTIKEELKIAKSDEKLIRSGYYPNIAVVGGLKRKSNSLRFDSNGYENADKSYIGVTLKWNIFDGGEKRHKREAILKKREATLLYLRDYEELVRTEIYNEFLTLRSLKSQLKASLLRLKSQKEYYRLTKERFKNALSSADELSRAIASLAEARANVEKSKAMLFAQRSKILLEGGVDFARSHF